MLQLSNFNSIIFILLVSLQLNTTINQTPLPLWSWECIHEKCVPVKAIPTRKVQSLMTCNMLCSFLQFWPQPTGYISISPTAVPLNANLTKLKITSSPSKLVSSYMRKAFKIFQNYVQRITIENGTDEKPPLLIRIAVNDDEDPRMRIDTDESYNLQLLQLNNDTEATLIADIKSNSFCGARHALETLSQLIWYDPYVHSLFIVKAAKIDDKPRFSYRGLMIDTAQNFFPVKELLQIIDAMATCKLNTFHWLATNSHSFPLLLKSLPELAKFMIQGYGPVYTSKNVRYVTKYASFRGIRVILEVNFPTFVFQPWVDPLQDKHEPAYCSLIPPNILHNTLKLFYEEIISLTEVNDIFHFGNDNVYEKCETIINSNTNYSNDLCLTFTLKGLQTLAVANGGKLPNITILRSSQSVDELKLTLQEYISNIGIQIHNVSWGSSHTGGIRTIISHEDAWDFNSGHGTWFENSNRLPYNSWQRIYEHRPWSRKGIGLMEGGEATVWSSTLSSGELESYVWPRAAALAERLWSDRAEGATRIIHARLDVYRSRLIFRGIEAAPLWSMWCTHNTFTC